MYFDGHDREDVIEDRKSYCDLMDKLGPRFLRNGRSTLISSERNFSLTNVLHNFKVVVSTGMIFSKLENELKSLYYSNVQIKAGM